MEVSEAMAAFLRWHVRIPGALLLFALSAMLWSHSRSRYFGLWAAAWLAETAAVACGGAYLFAGGSGRRVAAAATDLAFVFLLAAIAWSGISRRARILSPAPSTMRLVLAGIGLDILYHLALFIAIAAWGAPEFGLLDSGGIYDLGLHFLLLFLAILAWLETQGARIRVLAEEAARLQREMNSGRALDGLTGLLNQTALARQLEEDSGFTGVVSVCDLDNFKEVNDRYGHLVGDEILRNIGHLLRASIRQEDEAFRWGGDEFVVLFYNQNSEVARHRMEAIQARLKEFRLRGHGMIPISFSWGIAESGLRPLREVVDEADRDMYACKRRRKVS